MLESGNNKVKIVYQPNDSSIVLTFTPQYNFVTDAAEANVLAKQMLDSIDEQIYWVLDFSRVIFPEKLPVSLDEVIFATNSANAEVWHHRNIGQVVFVADNQILRAVAEGLNSSSFGNLNVKVFAKLDDALVYARSQRLK
jgi:hypothetical protein